MPRIIKSKFQFYRAEANLSMIEVAKRVGVAPSHLSRWVSGNSFPNDANARKLFEVMGAGADELVTFEEVKG